MTAPLAAFAPLFAGAGVLLSALILATTRRWTVALPVLLDLLLVAGLLRLDASASWRTITAAAAVVALRKVATWSLGRARTARLRPTPTASRR